MLNDILVIIYRSVVSLLVLFIISRVAGPRQISQLTFYDYIVGISIGSIAAMAVERDIEMLDMVISMSAFGGFTLLLAFLTSKSIKLRRLFSGTPSIMIYNGKIIESALKKNNYDINDLLLNCRLQGYFNYEDIAFAVLETNGQLSIMPKAEKAPLTPCDMSLSPSNASLEYNLIIDGNIMRKNLKAYGKDEQWLKAQLKHQNVKNIKSVLLGVGDKNDNLTVFLKEQKPPHNHFFI